MSNKQPIERLTIRGFKSIRELNAFPLRELNVLIGTNGSGKSNFVAYFRMLQEMIEGRLQYWTAKQGPADRIISVGPKETTEIHSLIDFGTHGYRFSLEPTADGRFIFTDEQLFEKTQDNSPQWHSLGSEDTQSRLREARNDPTIGELARRCYDTIAGWRMYHVHDTSDTAGMRRIGSLHDNAYLRPDGSNIAAFLYRVREEHPEIYQRTRSTISLAIPFFDDFVFRPHTLPSEEQLITLQWRPTDSDHILWPNQFSDGSLRLICLVTALLQPDPPSTMVIDEPELGLHPYAITMLGSLLQLAANSMQVIIATESVSLVDQFDIEDLIVVERNNGESVFRHLNEEDFKIWLEEYSVGELWEKSVLGGRPYS